MRSIVRTARVCAVVLAGFANAADAAEPAGTVVRPGEGPQTKIEEITVTARKVSESAQTVPIAITAFDADTIESEDLELDLFVSADRQSFVRLDMDEFEARQFDPATQAAALAALDELETLARAGDAPFDAQEPPPQAA